MFEEARLKYDVVTLAETMIRLSPPDNQRIEQAEYLYLKIGGAESNVALDLARLGLKTAWVSRLVDNPLGRCAKMSGGGVKARLVPAFALPILTGGSWSSAGHR